MRNRCRGLVQTILAISFLFFTALIAHSNNSSAQVGQGAGLDDVYDAYTPQPITPFPAGILPVKIVVSTQTTRIKASDSLEVSVRILNENKTPQNIGTETCGVHRLSGWVADNDSVLVQEGGSCRSNLVPPRAIFLQPHGVYKQTCIVSFKRGTIKSGAITFRLGLKYEGHVPAWSNALTLGVSA